MRAAAATLGSVGASAWPGVALVSYANAITLLLGFVQAAVTARALGPAGLGTVGVALGFGSVVANVLDVRLADIAGRALYESRESDRDGGPAAVVRAGALLQGVLAIAGFAITAGVLAILLPRFTQQAVALPTLLALAAAPAVSGLEGYLSYMQRFAERVGTMAAAQCVSAAAGTAVIVGIVLGSPSLDAYAVGLFTATMLAVTIHGVTLARLFPARDRRRPSAADCARILGRRRMLFMTNVLGYAKLLHRSADVLLVGFFCGAYQAGLYKCARSATDTLFAVNDVLSKTYQPQLFRLAAERNAPAFRRLGRRLFAGTLGLAGLALCAEVALLPVLVPRVFGAHFAGAVPAMIVLTLPVMWGFAVSVWAWPLLLTFTSLGVFTTMNFAAVLAGQYVIGVGSHVLFGGGTLPFAFGHAAVFVILYLGVLGFVRRRLPAFSPV